MILISFCSFTCCDQHQWKKKKTKKLKTKKTKKDDREDFQSLCVETAVPPPWSLIARPATSVGMFLRFSIIFEWWWCVFLPESLSLYTTTRLTRVTSFWYRENPYINTNSAQRFFYTKLMKYYALNFYKQKTKNKKQIAIRRWLNLSWITHLFCRDANTTAYLIDLSSW